METCVYHGSMSGSRVPWSSSIWKHVHDILVGRVRILHDRPTQISPDFPFFSAYTQSTFSHGRFLIFDYFFNRSAQSSHD